MNITDQVTELIRSVRDEVKCLLVMSGEDAEAMIVNGNAQDVEMLLLKLMSKHKEMKSMLLNIDTLNTLFEECERLVDKHEPEDDKLRSFAIDALYIGFRAFQDWKRVFDANIVFCSKFTEHQGSPATKFLKLISELELLELSTD